MRTLLTILAFALLSNQVRSQTREFFFKEIGWTLNMPSDFTIVDSIDNASRMQRGIKALEDVNQIQADVSKTVTLITATKNVCNYFNSTLEPFNEERDGSWEEANQKLKSLLLHTLREKMKDAKIDTASTKCVIDKLVFDRFQVTVKVGDRVIFNSFLLSKLYKGYDFGISYLYLDEPTRTQIELMLENSTFIKE